MEAPPKRNVPIRPLLIVSIEHLKFFVQFNTEKRTVTKCNHSGKVSKSAFKCVYPSTHKHFTAFAVLLQLCVPKTFSYCSYQDLSYRSSRQIFFPIVAVIGNQETYFCLLLKQSPLWNSKESLLSARSIFISSSINPLFTEMSRKVGSYGFLSAFLVVVVLVIYACFTNINLILLLFGNNWAQPLLQNQFNFEVADIAANGFDATSRKYFKEWALHLPIIFTFVWAKIVPDNCLQTV